MFEDDSNEDETSNSFWSHKSSSFSLLSFFKKIRMQLKINPLDEMIELAT
jgi:hypothetical protein